MEEVRIHYFANVTTFDIEVENYNKIANGVDSIFLNDGPFYMAYDNDEYFPVLSMHNDDYFSDGRSGVDFVFFEEQFADYVVLSVYKDKMGFALDRLYDMLGEEWFIMMDNYYEEVVGRMSERGKTFVKKGEYKVENFCLKFFFFIGLCDIIKYSGKDGYYEKNNGWK